MSWKAPAPILISRTPPSKPDSRLKKLWKLRRAESPGGTAKAGEVRVLSETVAALPVATPLGAETKNPAAVVVAQAGGGVAPVRAAVQPAGSDGATTPSKFSAEAVTKAPSCSVKVTSPRSVAPSIRCRVGVMLPPQVPCAVKVNVRETAGLIGVSAP